MNLNKKKKSGIVILLILFISSILCIELNYQKPSEDILKVFNQPYNPAISIYFKTNLMINRQYEVYMPYEFMAEPIIRIGGLEIYEKSRAKIRSGFFKDFSITNLTDGNTLKIDLPKDSKYGSESASFDEKKFLIHQYLPNHIRLWLVDAITGEAKVIVENGLTQANDESAQWLPDNIHILVCTMQTTATDIAPTIQKDKCPLVYETKGIESQNRTYPNLIKTSEDENLFDHFAMIQPMLINTETAEKKIIGERGLYLYMQISPDGKYLLYKEPLKPYSRKVYYQSFKANWVVLNLETNKKQILSTLDSYENLKTGWVSTGRRWYTWHPLKQHSLLFTQSLDNGSPDLTLEYSDEVRILEVPFDGEGSQLFKTKKRLSNFQFIDDSRIFVRENVRKQKRSIASILNLKTKQSYELWNRNSDEIYDLVGNPIMETMENGHTKILFNNNKIYLSEEGLSKNSRKPFIDELSLKNFHKKRIFELDSKDYTRIIKTDLEMKRVLISRENRQTPTNQSIIDINNKKELALTHFTNTVPELTHLQKRVINYQRNDGVKLSGIIYLPEKWDGSKRLPLIMSAYPEEFTNSETASQSSFVENRYSRPWGSSLLYLCLKGYAVLTEASFPIIGDPLTVNDTWMEQAEANAKAVISYLDQEGIVDTNKVVIQGHSYGAFMVLNLLSHTDLFAGGIARNGAYNRTLTPFGFQSEKRTLWQAKDLYLKLSPFLYVDQIKKPILLIHSMEDTNPGTYPIQSERLFEALEGNGKICRYVQLPLEDHNYVMKETHQHLLWEYEQFLDNLFK